MEVAPTNLSGVMMPAWTPAGIACINIIRQLLNIFPTSLPDDGHPVLQPVDAIGDLGEVMEAHGLLPGGEGAVVGAGALEVSPV